MDTPHVRLIHWNAAEAQERIRDLAAAGYAVDYEAFTPALVGRLRADPPAAVVIDLGRLPSQGRDLGLTLRQYKTTRLVPLVFAGGDPDKVARIRELLPDAVYAGWDEIAAALAQAVANPPASVVVPSSNFAAYAGAPLAQKLGIKAGCTVALVDAPPDWAQTLGALPDGVTLHLQATEGCDLVIWFPRSRQAMEREIQEIGARLGKSGLWVVWPKKASGVATDLSQPLVRQVGLASGLVDYKVCAIDATWTGLRFTRRARRAE